MNSKQAKQFSETQKPGSINERMERQGCDAVVVMLLKNSDIDMVLHRFNVKSNQGFSNLC